MARGGRLRRWAIALTGVGILNYYGTALYERFVPHERKREFQRKFGNPFGRIVLRWFPGWAVIETVGRRTGEARRVPVGGRRIGDTFWFVAVDPQQAAYVKNIRANPNVRVQSGGRWRTGVAHLLSDDEPRRRMILLNPANGLFIWLAGREHLTIRVDLGPA